MIPKKDFMKKVESLVPGCEVDTDSNGQVVVYTNLRIVMGRLVPMCDGPFRLAITLLQDEHGISEDAYTILLEQFSQEGQAWLQKHADATDGRYYLEP